jgi:N-acetyl-anhydromuramyl-L-alanine amidase AmpD
MRPRGILLHTVGVRGDSTAAAIRKYHVEHNGWRDIGYHFVVRKDGTVELGRPITSAGAHATGANDTIGICVTGDGDREPWTPAQRTAVISLCTRFCREHSWDPMRKVGGHREVVRLFGGAPTSKTCPGKLIDMAAVRDAVVSALQVT